MTITANCISVINGIITIRVLASELYPQTVIQLSEYDILHNVITPWTSITQLISTNQVFTYTLDPDTRFVRVRLISAQCEDSAPSEPEVCSGTLLIVVQESQSISADGVSLNSSVGSSLCFTPTANLNSVPSTFSIFINNEERASVTFWGDYIDETFIFTYNSTQYTGTFTLSNRIDF